MAFDFLDDLYNPGPDLRAGGADLLQQKKFIARKFNPPTSPRSSIFTFTEDDLLPISPAGDRYQDPTDPVAFEVSLVFPQDDTIRLNRDIINWRPTSETEAQLAEQQVNDRRIKRVAVTQPFVQTRAQFEESLRRQGLTENVVQATADQREGLQSAITDVEALRTKRGRAKSKQARLQIDKQIATRIDDYKKSAGLNSRIVGLDFRDPKQRQLGQKFSGLGKIQGLETRWVRKDLERQFDGPGIGFKEDDEALRRTRQAIAHELARLEDVPRLEFSVPPSEITLTMARVVFDSNLTQTGFQVEHWGESLDVLQVSGSTGGFYTVVRQTGIGGLNHQLRRGSLAFQQLMALVAIYKSNGFIYHSLAENGGQVNVPAALTKIQFGQHAFIGRFDEFNIVESDTNPFRLNYSFRFTSFATYLYGTDAGSPLVQFDHRSGPVRFNDQQPLIEEGTP